MTGPVAPIATPSPSLSPSPTRSPSSAPFPAPTPRPTRTASPTPAPTPLLGLAPGTHSSQIWQPRLTYSVPSGWWNDADDPTAFLLSKGHESPDNIELLVDLYPPGTDCGMVPDWTRAHGVDDLMDYLTGQPDHRPDLPRGGVAGRPRWVARGHRRVGHVELPHADWRSLSIGTTASRSVTGPRDAEEFTFLDGPDGRTIGIVMRAEGGVRDEATAIMDSFEFDLSTADVGARQTQAFTPRLTYKAPARWNIAEEDRAMLSLSHGGSDSIGVIANAFPPTIDQDGCSVGDDHGSRDSADRLVAYWTSHPGLNASTPEPFSIGNLKGWRVDVSLDPDWSASCPGATGPTGPVDFLHLWKGTGVPQGSGIGSDAKTLIALDTEEGVTIGIKLALYDTPALEEEALAIVKSFVFAPDGP